MIAQAVKRKHQDVQPLVETIAGRVRETVLGFCEKNGYAYIGRIKAADSIAEKLETGRFKSWSEIDDLFACTVVIPTLNHETNVLNYLRETFLEQTTKQRGSTKKAPDVFRFDATRFIGRLDVPDDLPSESELLSVCFEVQIRTAFEHAWTVATHSLTYKSGQIDWRLLRLTAQLKAAVEQLDSLVLAFETSAKQIVQHDWPELNAKRRLLDGFMNFFTAGQLPDEMQPKDMSRFAENVYSLLASSKGFNRNDALGIMEKTLISVDGYLSQHPQSHVPRSISLFQFVVAVLTENSALTFPLRKFHVLVTSELTQFYPRTKDIAPIVDLDS